jgi:hypothetical protein
MLFLNAWAIVATVADQFIERDSPVDLLPHHTVCESPLAFDLHICILSEANAADLETADRLTGPEGHSHGIAQEP